MTEKVYYVYLHIDPIKSKTVYIGKGRGGRAWDVTRARSKNNEHVQWMNDLMSKGYIPSDWVVIVDKNLSEKDALKLELSLIHSSGLTSFNKQSGEKQHQAKLTNEQALEIFKFAKEKKYLHRELAKMYNVSRTAISMIASRKQWKAVTNEVIV